MDMKSMNKTMYTCPMHAEVMQKEAGTCPKCGMALIKTEQKMEHGEMEHTQHVMDSVASMSWWDKFKMSMTMSMGMEHTGLAGRGMAKLMEVDIRNKFFFSLIL